MTQGLNLASYGAMHGSGPQGGDSHREMRGLIPGEEREPAFALVRHDPAPLPVLLAVPHAGRSYPAGLVARMRSAGPASLRLEDRFADLLAEAVARETGASLLVARAPRAMIDLNRSPDDMDWDMVVDDTPEIRGRLAAGRRARSGLGLVPRRLAGMGEIWKGRISRAELDARIASIHKPYHALLAEQLERLRDSWGAALLIDLHSMPPLGAKRGPNAAPDFVVGDRFGAACDPALSAAALDHFAANGWRAAHNRPYAGGYVLDRHAAPSRSIHALQVEVCRTAYLDSHLREPGRGMAATAAILGAMVRRLADELASCRGVALAAE